MRIISLDMDECTVFDLFSPDGEVQSQHGHDQAQTMVCLPNGVIHQNRAEAIYPLIPAESVSMVHSDGPYGLNAALVLFAGAGGADIGLRAAGFSHLACVEGDEKACATLRAAGFPAVHAWIGDGPQPERKARGKVQPPLPVWRHDGQPVDLLWASPPCQPYSRAGARKGADDARDGWPATLAAIREVRPVWVVIENVVGSPASEWADALRPLYPEVTVWRADAVDWGLPSHRDRVYIVAGPRRWTPPAPTHYGPRVPWLLRAGRSPWVSFGEALGLVGAYRVGAESGPLSEREERVYDGPTHAITTCTDGWRANQPYVIESCRGRKNGPQWEATSSDSPATCIRTASGGGGIPSIRLTPGNGGNLPAPRSADQPAHAVAASCPIGGKVGRRRLTPAECAILCGFPPDYPFQGGKSAAYRQIGNCVAPVMAEVIGRAILGAA